MPLAPTPFPDLESTIPSQLRHSLGPATSPTHQTLTHLVLDVRYGPRDSKQSRPSLTPFHRLLFNKQQPTSKSLRLKPPVLRLHYLPQRPCRFRDRQNRRRNMQQHSLQKMHCLPHLKHQFQRLSNVPAILQSSSRNRTRHDKLSLLYALQQRRLQRRILLLGKRSLSSAQFHDSR